MVDRISKLPDEALCHILSFLPTKNAVATSLLSKRWTSLWLSVPTLKFYYPFCDGREKSYSSFINFVYATILSRELHQPIKSFILEFEDECRYSDARVWINSVIQRKLENLEIYFDYISQLPCSIFGCTTLVVLQLSCVSFDAFTCVDLPSLKTLHLVSVQFPKCQHFMELLYGCPILENLYATYIDFDDTSFDGEFKSLSKLVSAVVRLDSEFYIPLKVFCNAELLSIYECDVGIPVFPNLIHVELVYGCCVGWSLALDILNHCPKLQTFDFDLDEAKDDVVWPYPDFVPKCFSSHLKKCSLTSFTGLKCEMRFARYIMQNSTLLRTIAVQVDFVSMFILNVTRSLAKTDCQL